MTARPHVGAMIKSINLSPHACLRVSVGASAMGPPPVSPAQPSLAPLLSPPIPAPRLGFWSLSDQRLRALQRAPSRPSTPSSAVLGALRIPNSFSSPSARAPRAAPAPAPVGVTWPLGHPARSVAACLHSSSSHRCSRGHPLCPGCAEAPRPRGIHGTLTPCPGLAVAGTVR